MTPGVRRLPLTGYHGATSSRHSLTGFDRTVRRTPAMPPLRPAEIPHGPSPEEAWRIFEAEDLWACTYCDAPLGGKVVGEVDHVIPLANGGPHALHNLTPACRRCNRGKSDRSAADWIADLRRQQSTER